MPCGRAKMSPVAETSSSRSSSARASSGSRSRPKESAEQARAPWRLQRRDGQFSREKTRRQPAASGPYFTSDVRQPVSSLTSWESRPPGAVDCWTRPARRPMAAARACGVTLAHCSLHTIPLATAGDENAARHIVTTRARFIPRTASIWPRGPDSPCPVTSTLGARPLACRPHRNAPVQQDHQGRRGHLRCCAQGREQGDGRHCCPEEDPP